MDSSQLEAFLAVYRLLSFTKAAEHLHISQSAITARIKGLEATVGKTLLQRDNRNVNLTQAGIAFLPYAEMVLRLLEESKLTLSEQFDHRVILSGPGSVWHYRYLKHLVAFREARPRTAVKLLSHIDPSYMVRDLLLDGAVHVSVRFDPPEHPKVSQYPLFEDEVLLVSASRGESVITRADFFSPAYCHIEWGFPFPDWFTTHVGTSYVPPLELDHSTIMLTILLQGSCFGFLPHSIAQPFLAAGQLHICRSEFAPLKIKAYALYLTEQRDHPSVKLGMELLGAATDI